MDSKPTGSWEFPIAALAVAAIVATMGFGAALAMKSQPEESPAGEMPAVRVPASTEPGISPDAKPDDVQTYH